MEIISQVERKLIVIDNADILLDDDTRRHISLDGKNQYGYFLDDNHAFIEIDTAYVAKDRELFLIKDSYANSLIPILAPHYEKIYVLDLRYYNGSLFSMMEQYVTSDKVDVLVVYNCIHFMEDFYYH